MSYEEIKKKIETVIRDNSTGDITAEEMRVLLTEMIDTIDLNHSRDITSISDKVSRNSLEINVLNEDVGVLRDHDEDNLRKIPLFYNFTTKEVNSVDSGNLFSAVVYSIPSKSFCAQIGSDKFTKNWPMSGVYNNRNGVPFKNKLFMTFDGNTYYFDGNDLRPVFDEVKGAYTTMELKAMMLRGELLPGYWYQVTNYSEYDKESLVQAKASIADSRAKLNLLIKAESSVSFSKKAKFIYETKPSSDNNSLEDWEVDYDIFGKGYALAAKKSTSPTPITRYDFDDIGTVTIFDTPLGTIYQHDSKSEFSTNENWGFCERAGRDYIRTTDANFGYEEYVEYAPVHCGIVTRMKDHRGNEAPFDFYNIALDDRSFVLPFNTDTDKEIGLIANNTIKPCSVNGEYIIPQVSITGGDVRNNIIEATHDSASIITGGSVADNIIYNSIITDCVLIYNCNIINSSLLRLRIKVGDSRFSDTVISEASGSLMGCDIEGGSYTGCTFSTPNLTLRSEFEISRFAVGNSGHVTPSKIIPFTPDIYKFRLNGQLFYTAARTTWLEFVIKESDVSFAITSDSVIFQGRPILYTIQDLTNVKVLPTDSIIDLNEQPNGYRI